MQAAEGEYSQALAEVLKQDKQLAQPLINLVEEQLAFHQSAIMLLETVS
jgi:hypothetical protein